MLQSFRDNLKGTVATLLVGLMIIPFALFGVDSLFLQNGSANEAASVDGEVITEQEVLRAIASQKDQMRARFGDALPAEFLSDERLRAPVLDELVQNMLMSQAAREGGMAVSDELLNEVILSVPQFQTAGQFDRQLYASLLRNIGYTPKTYKRFLTQQMLLNQHATGVVASNFVSDAELAQNVSLSQQTRDFYYVTVPMSTVIDATTVSDEQAQAYYDENQARFIRQEEVAVEYIELRPVDLVTDIEFSEEQLRQQYQQNVADFEAAIERRGAHILVEVKDDGSEQAVLAELQARLAEGEDFAALALAHSDDLGSRDQGGDLGFTTGDAFPEAFETALAALQVGEVSAAVETDSGFHLIKLLEEQGAEPPTFEEEKASIAQALKQSEADNIFVEVLEKLADQAYNADNLVDVAADLGLSLQTSQLFTRSGGSGVLAKPQVLAAVFSDEVLKEGNVSELIELDSEHIVVLRLTQREPSRTKTYDEVSTEIFAQLKDSMAKEKIAEQGEQIKAKLKSGQSVEAVAEAESLEWQVSLATLRNNTKYNREIVQHVFSLPKPVNQAEISGLQLSNGDFVALSLANVKDGSLSALSADEKKSLREQLLGLKGSEDFSAYQADLKAQADISIY